MKQWAALPFRYSSRPGWYGPLGYGVATAGVAVATLVLWIAQPWLSLGSVYLVYLVVVVAAAVGWGLGQAILASVLSFLCANFFFIAPVFTFAIAAAQDVLALVIFLGLATLTSQLVARLRREAREARRGQQVTTTLYVLSQTINRQHNLSILLHEVATQLCDALKLRAVLISIVDPGGLGRLQAHAGSPLDAGSIAEDVLTLPLATMGRPIGDLFVKLSPHRHSLGPEEERILNAFRDQLQMAIERTLLEQAATQTEVLRRTDALRVALLSAVAHDLRTPLASIKAAATSLLHPRTAWTEGDSKDFLTAIVSEVDRINHLATNLLDVSRIEAGILRPHLEAHHIGDIIHTVIERFSPASLTHPIDTDIEPALPAVMVDAVEIDEVLTNLLENAMKYTPSGTPIHIRAHRRNVNIQVEVIDEGPGIPPERIPRLFDRFYRATTLETAGAKSLGLGLSIVKGIVEAHGGRVHAENRRGGGAVFSFTLLVPEAITSNQSIVSIANA